MKQQGPEHVERRVTRAFAKAKGIIIEKHDKGWATSRRTTRNISSPADVNLTQKRPAVAARLSKLRQKDAKTVRQTKFVARPPVVSKQLLDQVVHNTVTAKPHTRGVQVDQPQPVAKPSPNIPITNLRKHHQLPKTSRQDKVNLWLHQSGRTHRSGFKVNDPVVHESYDMPPTSSSSKQTSSKRTTDSSAAGQETNESTAKPRVRKTNLEQSLENRAVDLEPTPDDRVQQYGLQQLTSTKEDEIELKYVIEFADLLEDNAKQIKQAVAKSRPAHGYSFFDSAMRSLIRWRPGGPGPRLFAPMIQDDFDWDRKHSNRRDSNEADMQRTLMLSMIDRFDFRDVFTFVCEEKWNVRDEHLLSCFTENKSRKISQPQPDLSISFDSKTIRGPTAKYTDEDLLDCLYPGTNSNGRWFPFFFFEAKKKDGSLELAFLKNLLSGSQALCNIYQWVKLCSPELQRQFFSDVRVFSMDMNNQEFRLRMHRAEQRADTTLTYKFVDLVNLHGYERRDICYVIKYILIYYAEKILLPILQRVFRREQQTPASRQAGRKRKTPGNLNDEDLQGESSQDTVLAAQHSQRDQSSDFARMSVCTDDELLVRDPRSKKRGTSNGGHVGK